MKSSIPSEERFKQKSNLLRLNFFLSTIAEFHFHGINFLRFKKITNAFFKKSISLQKHIHMG